MAEAPPGRRICIFGAGAIGGLIGARLAASGTAVTLIGRGAHLAAMRETGLRLQSASGESVLHPACIDGPHEAGPQDAVILCVKAPALPEAAEAVAHLLGPHTVLVSAGNGAPWWYFHGLAGPYAGHRLESVDPGGRLAASLPSGRVLGAVVYAAAEIVAPGIVRHRSGNRIVLGDPTGALGEEMATLAALLTAAGFEARVAPDIRGEIWSKLWGNLAFNPLSVLTGATLDRLAREPESQGVARRMMAEAQEVGQRLGVAFPMAIDRRIAAVADYGPHKTSMLQDYERGRPIELDALLGAVAEMGRLVGVATPVCEIVLGLVRQRARIAGCYPG